MRPDTQIKYVSTRVAEAPVLTLVISDRDPCYWPGGAVMTMYVQNIYIYMYHQQATPTNAGNRTEDFLVTKHITENDDSNVRVDMTCLSVHQVVKCKITIIKTIKPSGFLLSVTASNQKPCLILVHRAYCH